MKFCQRFFYPAVFLAIALVFSAADIAKCETQEITPADVYYLAHSIDNSLVAMYDLKTVFSKNRFSDNSKPRSSYQKMMNTLEEFNLIHGNVFSQSQLEELSKISPAEIKPAHLFQALIPMKNYLVEKGAFQEFKGERTPKQPRDVLYMLRQISFHHIEIAKKKNMITDWGTPGRVYEALVNDILPVLMKAADDVGLKYKDYAFPRQPTEEVSPWNVIKLLRHLYLNISQYHAAKVKYEPLVLNEITDCDEISPADVYDMIKIIAAEFRFAAGTKTLKPEMSKRYIAWKGSQSKILSGHVYRLLQYCFVLSEKIIEKMSEKKN